MPVRNFYLTSWNYRKSFMQPQAGVHQQCANSPQQARHTHQNIPGCQKGARQPMMSTRSQNNVSAGTRTAQPGSILVQGAAAAHQ